MWRVYTDGSASPNPGPGGAGAVILKDDQVVAKITNAGGHTTNNRMELYALIMSFSSLPKDSDVQLYTDSEYVQKGINSWVNGWIKNGWRTASKQPVKNKELWQQLLQLQKEYPRVKIMWIKAHQDKLPLEKRTNGWEWNMVADELANIGREHSLQN